MEITAAGHPKGLYRTPRLLTIDGSAEYLQIGRATLYRLIASGQIRTVKIGKSRRITVEALEEFVDSLATSGAA